MASSIAFAHLDVSANYDVELPVVGVPYDQRIGMAQFIPPKGADRFTFKLRPTTDQSILRVSFDLVHNAADSITRSGDFLLALKGNENGFVTGTEEEIQRSNDKREFGLPSEKERLINNTRTKAELVGIAGRRSKVVRAFEAGTL
jgi:hypothetical protein